MTLTKNTFTFICSLFFTLITSNVFGQSVSEQESNLEINQILKSQKSTCSVPLELQLSFNSKVDKVYNVKQVEEGININGNKKVIINTGVVYLKGKDSKALYSPEKIEREISAKLQKLMNIRLENAFKKIDSLNLRIAKWDSTLVKFGDKLKTLSNKNPKKSVGIALLKQYKQNIQTASCLNDDYGDEVIVEVDKLGNREFLFDIEKIKNDPNYLFVGKESEGLIRVKKWNKYGYLSANRSFGDIAFKYNSATPFVKGFANVTDENKIYLIDKNDKKKLEFNKLLVQKIEVLNDSLFLVHSDDWFFLQNKKKRLTRYYKKLTPLSYKKKYFLAEYNVSNNQWVYKEPNRLKKTIINNKGKIIVPLELTINQHNKFCVPQTPPNTKIIFEDAILLPNTSIALLQYRLFYKKDANSKIDYKKDIGPLFYYLKDLNSNKYLGCNNWYSTPNFVNLAFGFKNIENTSDYKKRENIVIAYLTDQLKRDYNISLNKYGYFEKNQIKYQIKKIDKIRMGLFKPITLERVGAIADKYHLIIPEKNLIIFSDYISFISDNEKKGIIMQSEIIDGYGVMNYNGLFIVPPIFKSIEWKNQNFNLLSINNEKFTIDSQSNCIKGDCKKYRKLNRDYFTLLNKLQN